MNQQVWKQGWLRLWQVYPREIRERLPPVGVRRDGRGDRLSGLSLFSLQIHRALLPADGRQLAAILRELVS